MIADRRELFRPFRTRLGEHLWLLTSLDCADRLINFRDRCGVSMPSCCNLRLPSLAKFQRHHAAVLLFKGSRIGVVRSGLETYDVTVLLGRRVAPQSEAGQ